MEPKKDLISKLRRAFRKMRTDGFVRTARHYLWRVGIEITPFHYMKEVLPAEIPPSLTALPDGFQFSVFGPDEVAAIDTIPERQGYVPDRYVAENFQRGDLCLGIKQGGRIAAFTWTATDATRAKLYKTTMRPNEAYLFDMYVLQDFRGKNLAPILRYKNYEMLRENGRDTFYSTTVVFNTASARFKQKLGAQKVFLAVYFELFGKLRWTWKIRTY